MKNQTFRLSLIAIAMAAYSGIANADLGEFVPPEATPPAEPQKPPKPQAQATAIHVENRLAEPLATNNAMPEKDAAAVEEKTLNEISAMLVDIVQHGKNVTIIDQPTVPANAQPAVDSSRLAVPDEPHGHYRVFSEVTPQLVKGKAELKLQILRAGHRGDANDMLKPLAEKTFQIDPANVRAAEKDIQKFIFGKIDIQLESEDAKGRPELTMWIEVSNEDGKQGVDDKQNIKEDSKIIIYYKANEDVYVSLYHVNNKGNIKRLVPTENVRNNYARKGQILRYPPTGEGLTLTGEGIDKIRAIYTTIPSSVGSDLGTNGKIQSKQSPVAVIPTQYPPLFATPSLTRFFSLPEQFWNQSEIEYKIVK